MRVERLNGAEVARLGGAAGLAAHLRSLVPGPESVQEAVREIIEAVRTRGDEAVLEYTRRFDTSASQPRPLLVAAQELDDALKRLPLEVVAGLQVAIANVAQVAHAGTSEDVSVQLAQGQRVRLREVPVASAAVYVPGGRAPYPSTVVMGVVTAAVAGVPEVVVASPPPIADAILAACQLTGVGRVYRMGGAQAIAALAYGTDSVPVVDVIVGPGNLYVQEAKRQLSAEVGIDGFAGPSDLVVIADGTEDPELVALDLLAQAEHGPGTLVVGVSTSATLLDELHARLSGAEETGAAAALVEVGDLRDGLGVAQAFAPEHLQLMGGEAEALAPRVTRAGCLFVGTGTAFGDYIAGSNHVLPTAGAARFASGLSAAHFRRHFAEVRIDDAASLASAAAPIARAEGFELHARSMEARIRDNH
jgi:histidinol dehydrogenase